MEVAFNDDDPIIVRGRLVRVTLVVIAGLPDLAFTSPAIAMERML